MLENYDKAVSLFLANMRGNSLAENSVESYSRTFQMFRRTLVEHGFTCPCVPAVIAFKEDKADVALTSLALYLGHLRQLSDFGVETKCFDEGFVTDNCMPPRRKVAAERKKEYDHILTEAQVEALITAQAPTKGRKPHTWLREKAETVLLLQSGLRNSELRALTPNDLDWENVAIHARETKGDKPRYVPFNETAQEAVRAYLNSGLRPAWVGDDEALFGCVSRDSGKWKPMDRRKLSERILYYTKSILGEEAACRTHALRHGYASVLLEHDVPMQLISESLGHANPATTAIYAKRLTKEAPAQTIGGILDAALKKKQNTA